MKDYVSGKDATRVSKRICERVKGIFISDKSECYLRARVILSER